MTESVPVMLPKARAGLITGWMAAHPGALLGALLAACVVLALHLGAVPLTAADWLALLGLYPEDRETLTGGAYVLWNLRLPRALFAMLVGAALGLSGALTQGLFRNPLADPGLLGVTSGAACAAALTIVLLARFDLALPVAWRYWLLPVAAFAGAIGVCLFLDLAARRLTAGSIAGLLLTGIALNALASAFLGLCTYLATDEQLRSLSFWMLGSLAGANWGVTLALFLLVMVGLWRARALGRAANALSLGEAVAAHIGVDVRRLRSHIVILVAVLCGFAVAYCGMIGFVGLLAPHLVRHVAGCDQRRVIPLSAPTGALLLLVADTAARTLAIPAEIPVGILTALLGAPCLFILLSSHYHHRG